MSKKRLMVMFGGKTVEHEVSVITGLQLISKADPEKYNITPVYIDKRGQWWSGELARDMEFYRKADLNAPQGLDPFSISLNAGSNPYDAAILCFHGGYGEAGNIQGVLEVAGIPYQGPGVVSSAICFDKIVLRQIFEAEGVPQAAYTWFTAEDWQQRQGEVTANIDQLSYPIYIKPANGGSTIGIERVGSADELTAAVDRVLTYDNRILVEAEIKDCLEINVSVLGSATQAEASVPEQPIKSEDFLSYADKYQRGGSKKSGMASATRRIPAPISSTLTQKLQDEALRIFKILDCTGVIRIDFFVEPSSETIYVIEPNTIPGSMSFYLWEASGKSYSQLIDRLVEIALERAQRQQALTTSFENNILLTAKVA